MPRPNHKRHRGTGEVQVKAMERLEGLEAEFVAFKNLENPEMSKEEYDMLDRSFQQKIERERDYWDMLEKNAIPMRTFPLQVRCKRLLVLCIRVRARACMSVCAFVGFSDVLWKRQRINFWMPFGRGEASF